PLHALQSLQSLGAGRALCATRACFALDALGSLRTCWAPHTGNSLWSLRTLDTRRSLRTIKSGNPPQSLHSTRTHQTTWTNEAAWTRFTPVALCRGRTVPTGWPGQPAGTGGAGGAHGTCGSLRPLRSGKPRSGFHPGRREEECDHGDDQGSQREYPLPDAA
ncbi:MAG: hypothetical protein EB027_05185, partial [Actinobacteria bacterium]|nr:hypothetical protein [Actinomycetota bacterium]